MSDKYASVYDPIAVASIDRNDKLPHDNAVVRAINSVYKPNKKLAGKPENTLFVARIHPKVLEEELSTIFSKFGRIKRCTIVRDLVTGYSKQYAFVEFEKQHHANRAYRHANRKIVRGAEILVDWEFGRTMRGWKPRSLGGGFGGRKESGQLRFGCRDRPWVKPITIESNQFPRDKRR